MHIAGVICDDMMMSTSTKQVTNCAQASAHPTTIGSDSSTISPIISGIILGVLVIIGIIIALAIAVTVMVVSKRKRVGQTENRYIKHASIIFFIMLKYMQQV
jgi:hypothetical protein